MLFSNTVKHIQRIQQVIGVFLKYGFEDVVTTTALSNFIPAKLKVDWMRDERPVFGYTRWERVRLVIEELGPTFIKFAQLLSNRPDVLPQGLIQEFEKLQDNVPAFPPEVAREIVAQETGRSVEDTFSFFDDRPLGSASIGQVHRARLLSGEDVVIKLQRPGARRQIESDLAIIKELVRQTEGFFNKHGILNPLEIVDTFEKSMSRELDYRVEGRNIENFRQAYLEDKRLYVPKPYGEYTTRRMLVMEYVSGCKITDVEQLQGWGLDLPTVARNGLNIYFRQIFEIGFFHADPHPGNVLVRPDGTIVLLDFGMIGKLNRQNRYAFGGFLVDMANTDARGMAQNLKRLTSDLDVDDPLALEVALFDMVEDLIIYGNEQTQIADMTVALQRIIYENQMSIPGDVFLILRALAILEGIGRVLYPDLKVIDMIRPYGMKLVQERFAPQNMANEAYHTALQMSSLIYNIPMEARYLLRKTRTGKLETTTHLRGLEPFVNRFHQFAARANLTLLICALFIGSSIMTLAPFAPSAKTSGGLPYISLVGFVLALLLLISLLISNRQKH